MRPLEIHEPYQAFALFDFDGTLIKGDSIVLFLRFALHKGLAKRRDVLRALCAAVGYGLKLCSAEKSKARSLTFLKGHAVSEIRALSDAFASEVLIPRLRKQGAEEMRALKEKGAQVLLISASPDFYLESLRGALPLDDIIATRMDTGTDGMFTGLICGENCRGLQKPLRLAEYLASKGARLDFEQSCAYGDSYGDMPMLLLCKRRVLVCPKKKLVKAMTGASDVSVVMWGEDDKGR